MDSFGDPAELVAEDGKAFADELEQPVMDRPWFCSAYAAAGYFMCDPLTNVPKWCSSNITDVMCPEEKGFEYTPVAGGGGSSGGGGAKRTWDQPKILDQNYETVNIPFPTIIPPKDIDEGEKCWSVKFTDGFKEGQRNYDDETKQVPCSTISYYCVDLAGIKVNCNVNQPIQEKPKWYQDFNSCGNGFLLDGTKGTLFDCKMIFSFYVNPLVPVPFIYIDERGRILDPVTYIPINNDKIKDGVPIYIEIDITIPPTDPPDIVIPPDGSPECATIVCECISAVVRTLGIVNESVLKVDSSVLKVVSAITGYKPSIPEPFDLKPVTDRLSDILKAVDSISVEIVKEAGTNFWDVLGGAFKDIFDLIEFLIEKIIYLVVPEDTSNIISAFDSLNSLISAKMKPVEQVKTAVDGAMNVQKKNFQDIYIDLPTFGRVKFFETEYIEIALPYVRRILSAMMILMTAFYAYRKVSSEMIR